MLQLLCMPAKPIIEEASDKKTGLSSSDLPSRSLRDALRVSQALTDNYAGAPTAPHDIALALSLSPTSSSWRDLAAASHGYGLTKGSWNAGKISLEPLGRRATSPLEEGDDQPARVEAALRPAVLGKFFRKYNKAKFPPDPIVLRTFYARDSEFLQLEPPRL